MELPLPDKLSLRIILDDNYPFALRQFLGFREEWNRKRR